MGEDQNNLTVGTKEGSKTYLKIVIAVCAVIVIAVGVVLGYKLTHKDTPKETKKTLTETPTDTPTVTPTEVSEETPTEAPKETPTVTPKETKGEETSSSGEWVLYKAYEYSGNEKILDREREYFYDEQGRLTKENCCHTYDDTVDWTYYSYDCNGEKMENWSGKDGQLNYVRFTDMTGTTIYVDGWNGETYQEEFYDDGYIKEFRIYGGLSEKLEKMVKWEYDAGKKNIRRMYYTDCGSGEPELVDDVWFELDSDGRVVRFVDREERNENEFVPSAAEYECRYEGNRQIETYTYTDGDSVEVVSEGDRVISKRIRCEDGTGSIEERFYPNANLLTERVWEMQPGLFIEYICNEIEVAADGTEKPLYKVEFTSDGQPLRKIMLETGEVCDEYQYGPDGKLLAVLNRPFREPELLKMVDIKYDQYGNPVEYTDYWGGTYTRFEWIRLADVKQQS